MEAKVLRRINLDTEGIKASLLTNLRLVVSRFTFQGPTITTDATTTDTSSLSRLKIIENHPLVPVFGVFQDDPTWDDFKRSMEEYSQQVDAFERTIE